MLPSGKLNLSVSTEFVFGQIIKVNLQIQARRTKDVEIAGQAEYWVLI